MPSGRGSLGTWINNRAKELPGPSTGPSTGHQLQEWVPWDIFCSQGCGQPAMYKSGNNTAYCWQFATLQGPCVTMDLPAWRALAIQNGVCLVCKKAAQNQTHQPATEVGTCCKRCHDTGGKMHGNQCTLWQTCEVCYSEKDY